MFSEDYSEFLVWDEDNPHDKKTFCAASHDAAARLYLELDHETNDVILYVEGRGERRKIHVCAEYERNIYTRTLEHEKLPS